jgi:hypothetical protein
MSAALFSEALSLAIIFTLWQPLHMDIDLAAFSAARQRAENFIRPAFL